MQKNGLIVLVYILLSFASIMVYIPYRDLHPDEAHYWVWSTRPQAGYFDNGPLIALVIRASTAIFGRNEFGVRFPAALAYLLLSLIVYLFARRVLWSRPAALLSAVLFSSMPIALIGGHTITHDVPLMICTALTWIALYRALVQEKKNAWYLAGLFFGLALLSKYQAVLIGLSVLLLLALDRRFRTWLSRKEPYLAAFIALAIFSPCLYWNSRNNWISFAFQFSHGIQTGHGINLANIAVYLGGQMGVVSIAFFLALCYYTIKRLLSRRALSRIESFLMAGFLPTLAFFALTSLTYTAYANWPVSAYFTASVFVAGEMLPSGDTSRSSRRILLWGFIILLLIGSWIPVLLARYPERFQAWGIRLPDSAQPALELQGWRQFGQVISSIADREFPGCRIPIFAEGYGVSSEILFYTHHPIDVYATPRQRLNQFDLWTLPDLIGLEGNSGLLATNDAPGASELREYFDRVDPLEVFVFRKGSAVIRTFYISRVKGIKAGKLRQAILHKNLGYRPGVFLRSSGGR